MSAESLKQQLLVISEKAFIPKSSLDQLISRVIELHRKSILSLPSGSLGSLEGYRLYCILELVCKSSSISYNKPALDAVCKSFGKPKDREGLTNKLIALLNIKFDTTSQFDKFIIKYGLNTSIKYHAKLIIDEFTKIQTARHVKLAISNRHMLAAFYIETTIGKHKADIDWMTFCKQSKIDESVFMNTCEEMREAYESLNSKNAESTNNNLVTTVDTSIVSRIIDQSNQITKSGSESKSGSNPILLSRPTRINSVVRHPSLQSGREGPSGDSMKQTFRKEYEDWKSCIQPLKKLRKEDLMHILT